MLANSNTPPLPLGYAKAVARALELRETHDLSYRTIAAVMTEYHGFKRCTAWWKLQLHAAGARPRPRGAAYPPRVAA